MVLKPLSHLYVNVPKTEIVSSASSACHLLQGLDGVLVTLVKGPGRCRLIVSQPRCYGNLLLHPWCWDSGSPRAPGWLGFVLSTCTVDYLCVLPMMVMLSTQTLNCQRSKMG